MAKKSSYMLAVLLIANPFMLLFFQNCSKHPQHAVKESAPSVQQQQKSASSEKEIS